MWVGIILGILFGGLFALIPLAENEYLIGVIVIVISIVLCGLIGIYADNIYYQEYINSYIAKKDVIEESITNDNISDLEKIEIVKQIVELNGELAEKKIEYNQKFLYFYLDSSKINELEKIKIKEDK